MYNLDYFLRDLIQMLHCFFSVGGSQPIVFSYVSEFFTEKQRGPMVIILASCWQPGIIFTGALYIIRSIWAAGPCNYRVRPGAIETYTCIQAQYFPYLESVRLPYTYMDSHTQFHAYFDGMQVTRSFATFGGSYVPDIVVNAEDINLPYINFVQHFWHGLWWVFQDLINRLISTLEVFILWTGDFFSLSAPSLHYCLLSHLRLCQKVQPIYCM